MIESEKWVICLDTEDDNSRPKEIKKLTDKEKELLINSINYLEENCEWFKGHKNDWLYDDLLENWYEEWEKFINLIFPTQDDDFDIDIDEFNNYIEDFKTIKFEKNLIITNKTAYLKVIPNFTEENYSLYMENCLEINTDDNISIYYDEWCFIPWLFIIKEEMYEEDLIFPTWGDNQYIVINKKWWWNLTFEECRNNIIIYKYLAEVNLWLSFVHDNLFFNSITREIDDEFILEWDYKIDYPIDCLKDYTEACIITNPQIKYTLLFRVLEYISVSSNHAELLKDVYMKLEEFKWKNIEWTDIKEVVWLIKSKKITGDYIKTLLNFITIESFIDLLPGYIRGEVLDGKNIDIKILADFLTNTRHKYSHAKPNYNNKSFECKDDDIEEFNIFIDKLVQESIGWYTTLDDYLKIK